MDDHLRTSVAGVLSLGDANGGPQFTYISLDDFRVVRDRDTRGLIKIVVDAETDLVLGATVFCVDSQEIINLVALAMRHDVTATELRDAIYTHPSSTEALNEVLGELHAAADQPQLEWPAIPRRRASSAHPIWGAGTTPPGNVRRDQLSGIRHRGGRRSRGAPVTRDAPPTRVLEVSARGPCRRCRRARCRCRRGR